MNKKLIALLLASVMSVSLLAGCNKDTPAPVDQGSGDTQVAATPKPADDTKPETGTGGEWDEEVIATASYGTADLPDHPNPVTFTYFSAGAGKVPSPNNKVLKELARVTGVTIEWEFTPGDIDQKVGVVIAGGNYADFIGPGQHRGEFLNAGAFVNVDGMIQDYPRLWAHFGPYEQRLRNATLDNSIRLMDIFGRRYYVNDGNDALYGGRGYNGPAFWIQKDVLAWDNYANPTTLTQFFDLLERYTAANPTIDGLPTLPFEVFSTDWRSFSLKNPPQHLIGGRNEGDVVVNPDTLEVEIYQDKWYAHDYYQTLNDAYKRGLINPETFTRLHDDFMSVIAQGRVLAVFSQQWAFGEGESVLTADGRIERTYVPLGLTFDKSEPYPYNRQTHSGIQGGNGGGISVSCQDVDRALEFMDMLLMPEIHTLLSWGIEGEDFYVTDEGRFRRTLEQKNHFDDPDWKRDNSGDPILQAFPHIEGRLPNGNAADSGTQPEEIIENMQPYDKEFYSHYKLPSGESFSDRSDFLPEFEHPGYSEIWSLLSTMDSEAPERATFDKMTDIQNRYLPNVIMADDFESAWTKYIDDNYVPLADEITALEDWIEAGIKEEIATGVYAIK